MNRRSFFPALISATVAIFAALRGKPVVGQATTSLREADEQRVYGLARHRIVGYEKRVTGAVSCDGYYLWEDGEVSHIKTGWSTEAWQRIADQPSVLP